MFSCRVFFSVITHITVINNNINDDEEAPGPLINNQGAPEPLTDKQGISGPLIYNQGAPEPLTDNQGAPNRQPGGPRGP